MLVWLTFLVCTVSGVSCHVTVPTDQPFVGLAPCQVGGMTAAAEWQDKHHGWRVARIRCTLGNPPADPEGV
jgi:hypothetical protein